MKFLKKFGKILAIFLVVLIAAMIAIPYFFKGQILEKVKTEANNNINATVDFKDVNLSLFRSFPDFSLGLEGLTVDGINEFKGVRLADVGNFDMTLDIMSVIRGDETIQLKGIHLTDPTLYVKVMKDGTANYDIAKPSEDTTTTVEEPAAEASEFAIELSSYSITNGNVIYDDASMDVFVDLVNINHSGKGDFTATVYDLITRTTADAVTVDFGGIKYFNKTKTDIDMTINIDMDNSKYTFKDNNIKLNALAVDLDGFVAMPENGIDMDLKFGSPSTQFKHLLSMIPSAFTQDFGSVKAGGSMAFNGTVKGLFNDNSMPAVNINLGVKDGDFKYPDLPLSVDNINTKVNIKSPNQNFDNLVVDVAKFHIDLGKNPFDAVLLLKNPLTDPYVKTKVDGVLDLGQLAKAFPMEGVETMNGIITANLDTETRLSYIEKEQYDKVDMNGKVSINNMIYDAADMPKVDIKDLAMDFTPQNVKIDNFEAKLGKSDLKASGTLDNILTYFSREKTMKGVIKARSNLFDANEWLSGEPSKVQQPDQDYEPVLTPEEAEAELFDQFAIDFDGEVNKLLFDVYTMTDIAAKGTFTPKLFKAETAKIKVGKSDFEASGSTLENIFGYLFDGETIKGDLTLRSNLFDVNELMALTAGGETTTNGGSSGGDSPKADEPVFGKFDLKTDAKIGRVLFDVHDVTDIAAKGEIGDEVFDLESFKLNIGNSDLSGSGKIENAIDYVFKENQVVKGDIKIASKFFDLNQFMVAAPVAPTENSTPPKVAEPVSTENLEPILIPDDFEFNIDAKVGKVLYEDINLNNISGNLVLKDNKVALNDIAGKVFGGGLKLKGSYDTQDKAKPKFDFGYVVDKLDVQQAFKKLESFKLIAPIAKSLYGTFNSDFTLNGTLGKDMMPDLNSLNSTGFFETIETVLKGSGILGKVSQTLNLKDVNPFELKNTKNWFTIKDGKVAVKPFDVKFKGIGANISGSHSIGQDIDYTIKMKVPRKLLEKNSATAALNTGLKLLGSQASKLGINLAQGENINLNLLLTGKVADPKVKVKLTSVSGEDSSLEDAAKAKAKEEAEKLKKQAEEELAKKKKELEGKAKAEADKLKAKAEAEAEKKKKELEAKAKAEADKLKAKLEAEAAKKKKELEDKIGKELTDKLNKEAKEKAEKVLKDKLDQETKDKLKKEAEKAKEKLDKFNPFKKKKKDNN